MKFALAEHQRYALEMMKANKSMGIFYEMGTGKTAIALMFIYRRVQSGECNNALIVCPASLVANWEANIDKLTMFEGVTEDGVAEMKKRVVIRSYQKMYRSRKTESKRSLMLREDIDHLWDILICDESQNLGSHSSTQTKAAIQLARLSVRRYIMTGTPVHGGGGGEDFSKLYGQMRILEPMIWRTWKAFCQECVASYDYWGKPEDYKVDRCHEIMEEHSIVCRLEQVFDMPGCEDVEVPCKLAMPKVYSDIKKGCIEEYNIDIKNAGNPYVKLLQVCSGSLKDDDGNTTVFKTSKDDALWDIVNGTSDPIVVFCTFRASIDRVAGVCDSLGRTVAIVDGRHKGDEWKEFQAGKKDVCICQYQSGGAGLDLFRAHIQVFYEPHPSAEKYAQARARIYRKGQEQHCRYYILSTPGTIEAQAWDTVRKGEDVSARMLDRWAREES